MSVFLSQGVKSLAKQLQMIHFYPKGFLSISFLIYTGVNILTELMLILNTTGRNPKYIGRPSKIIFPNF